MQFFAYFHNRTQLFTVHYSLYYSDNGIEQSVGSRIDGMIDLLKEIRESRSVANSHCVR